MPIFYFNVTDQSGTIARDEAGAELADLAAALARAKETGRQFLKKEVSADGLLLDDPATLSIEVKDSSGHVVCTIPLSELTNSG
jgi:hypothetical protein